MPMPYKAPAQFMEAADMRALRSKYKLSQADLARLLGVSMVVIKKLEAGDHFPRIYELALQRLRFDLEQHHAKE